MPAGHLARFQVVEYLRAFLYGRVAWDALGALFIVSGAFGLFRRDVVEEVRLRGRQRRRGPRADGADAPAHARPGRPYRITFAADPVSGRRRPPTWPPWGPAAPLAPRPLGEPVATPLDDAAPPLRRGRDARAALPPVGGAVGQARASPDRAVAAAQHHRAVSPQALPQAAVPAAPLGSQGWPCRRAPPSSTPGRPRT